MSPMMWGGLIYGAGVALGLGMIDGAPGRRVPLAVAWPLGVASFFVTTMGLMAASLILFPRLGAGVSAAAALWWLLG